MVSQNRGLGKGKHDAFTATTKRKQDMEYPQQNINPMRLAPRAASASASDNNILNCNCINCKFLFFATAIRLPNSKKNRRSPFLASGSLLFSVLFTFVLSADIGQRESQYGSYTTKCLQPYWWWLFGSGNVKTGRNAEGMTYVHQTRGERKKSSPHLHVHALTRQVGHTSSLWRRWWHGKAHL